MAGAPRLGTLSFAVSPAHGARVPATAWDPLLLERKESELHALPPVVLVGTRLRRGELGMFARRRLARGWFLGEYKGVERGGAALHDPTNAYLLDTGRGVVIDARDDATATRRRDGVDGVQSRRDGVDGVQSRRDGVDG
eukprot:gene8841-3769_t